VEPAKVPQHLELEDVVAWGLSATDLLCVVGGAVVGWWLYLALPGDLWLRGAAAVAPVLLGAALGVLRLGELALRGWLAVAAAYLVRPRVLVT